VKFARTAAVLVAALFALGACTSTPSAKAVAQDFIESIDGLTDAQRECMLEKLDNDYTSDELETIGEANVTVDFDSPEAVANATPEFRAFVDNLAKCMTDSG
jgi:hypothetical protein